METQTESKTPKKILAGKLCIAASIILLLRISLFFLCLLFSSRRISISDGLGLYALSMAIFGLVVPFFGLLAIRDILSNWRSVTNPDYVSKNKTMVRRIAYSFLITGLFFALVSLLHEIFVIHVRNIQVDVLPTLPSIWLIIMALMALLMSCISYKLFTKTSVSIRLRIGAIFGIIVGFVAVVSVFLSTSFGYYLIQRIEYSTIPEISSVDSSSLKQMSIVPTLDSPCSKNKNVIWCSSFQLAWNRMKDDVIGAPVEVVGAEELAARLNSAEQTADDLKPYSVYAAAGRIYQGIIDRIQKDMAAKFPSHSVPDFGEIAFIPEGILAYSYLIANVPFEYPYRQVRVEFIFTDSNGIETNVGAFGAWGLLQRYKRMREQVEILYFREDYNEPDRDLQMKEFAIDLCKHSKPYQVVAAFIEPKASLAQSLDYISNKMVDFQKNSRYKNMTVLNDVDVLMVPEMFWEIDHRFVELIGKIVANANPPMPIVEAKQSIKFKLDRYGAMLESEATFAVSAVPRYFIFNRPFLVYMTKRDCEQPFFVMWVDNAELLNKK
jgi:hypothetical protein